MKEVKEIKVYGKKVCPNCDKAKNLIKSKGLDFEYVDLEEDLTKFFELIDKGFKQVPVIEINDNLISGYDNLVKELEKAA